MYCLNYSLSIDAAFAGGSVMSALCGAVVVGHGVEIVHVTGGAVQRERPHIQVCQREINVCLFLFAFRVIHVLSIQVKSFEVNHKHRRQP